MKQNCAIVRISPTLSARLANMGVVCAMLVVLIHCYVPAPTWSAFWWATECFGGGKWLHGGFVRCAVPYFFLVSGFFLAGHIGEDGWWSREVLKRVRSLLLPYAVWSAVAVLMVAAYSMMVARVPLDTAFWLDGFGLRVQGLPLLKQLWFIKCLFLLTLLSPIISRMLSVWTLALLWAIYWCLALEPLPLPWQVYSFFGNTFSLEGVFYFSLGIWLRTHPVSLNRPCLVLWVAVIGCVIMLLIYAISDGYGWRFSKLFQKIAVPFSLMLLWQIVPARPWPTWLTRNAFPVFVLHLFPLMVIRRSFGTSWAEPPETWLPLYLIGSWGIAVGTALLAAEMLRRVCPRGAALVFGGR